MKEPSVNRVVLLGRLVIDPEHRIVGSTGTTMCRLRVATNESYKDRDGNWQETATYHTVILWGRVAEVAAEYLHKGRRVYIEGRLRTRSWEDRDGNKRWSNEITGRKMIMLDRNGDQSAREERSGASTPGDTGHHSKHTRPMAAPHADKKPLYRDANATPQPQTNTASYASSQAILDDDDFDDDLPF